MYNKYVKVVSYTIIHYTYTDKHVYIHHITTFLRVCIMITLHYGIIYKLLRSNLIYINRIHY